jgi:hypothetical protein
MPIWLRKYTFNSINEFYQKEQEEYQKASGQGELVTANRPLAKQKMPDSVIQKPTYTSKVSKK